MSDDLRTGLVEAIARVLIDDPHCDDATNQKVWNELAFTVKDGIYEKVGAIVDRTLGFLTDNAEALKSTDWLTFPSGEPGEEVDAIPAEMRLSELVAVLSGSGDTAGEKPYRVSAERSEPLTPEAATALMNKPISSASRDTGEKP